jgi:flagellar hook-associated protein 2
MGSITTGIGLVSGIDIASLIESLITLESAGKFRLQDRIGELGAQRTALLDVNARLLNLKNAASSFRINRIFESALATSTDEEVLTASAGTGAAPGSYTFIVKELVTTSQVMAGGFATRDASPLGLDQLSFEFGRGRLTRDRPLEELNGGTGVDRGTIVITDRSDATATIDLSDVTSMNEVIDRINSNTDVSVTATIDDDHLVITDDTGQTTVDLQVADGSGDTTATDLGIAGTGVGNQLTGTSVLFIAGSTALDTLNDGNGVLIRNNVTDFTITARDGTMFEIDLGRIDADIDDATLLEDLNDGAGIGIDDDGDTNDLKLVDRNGTEYEFDLTGVTTVGGLRGRIATATGGNVTLEVSGGDRFKVVDSTGGTGLLRIEGTEDNGTTVAEDLGILLEEGVAADEHIGTIVPSTIDQPRATTVQEVLDRVNDALDTTEVPNGGRIVASLGANGLIINDNTGGFGNLVVTSSAANPDAADDLGLETGPIGLGGSVITGERIIAGLDTVLARSLNGGGGLNGATTIAVSDREGDTFLVANLDTFDTLDAIVDHLNAEAAANNVDVTIGLNATGTGLAATDTTGSTANNLIIAGDGATALGLDANVAADTFTGANVQLKYVGNAAALEDLDYGRGIGVGRFRITDGLGQSAEVDIGGTEESLYDVIQEINALGIAVTARVNDQGDGLLIEEDPVALGGETAFVPITVETLSGTAARDLNIVGVSEDIEGGFIDGSYERVVDLATSDTLDEVVAKINAEGVPVTASVINVGSGSTPYHLNLTSAISGRNGDLIIDTGGVDLDIDVLSEGKDAKVFFGSSDPADALLITSSTNTLDEVIADVTIDLVAASDDPVTLTIARDENAIVGTVQQLVTTFNDAIGRMSAYDFYDVDTEERGVLLGDPTIARVRSGLYRVAAGSALNLDGSYRFLTQVGITFGSEGQMSFDEGRFRDAYEQDPAAVQALFDEYDIGVGGTEEIAPGVTVESSTTTFRKLGFGNLFDNLLDDLTNSVDGTVTLADDAFERQIGLLEDRIETMDERLAVRREQLQRQFTAMELALAQLQGQAGALSSLSSNLLAAASQGLSTGG